MPYELHPALGNLHRGERMLVWVYVAGGSLMVLAGIVARAMFVQGALPTSGWNTVNYSVLVLTGVAAGLVAWRARLLGWLRSFPLLSSVAFSVALAAWGLGSIDAIPSALEAAGGAVFLAGYLGHIAVRQSTTAFQRILFGKARLIRPRGRTTRVPIETLGPGDQVRVSEGETIPVDGLLLEGPSEMDGTELGLRDMVTVSSGEAVFAGFVPNQEVDVAVKREPGQAMLAERDRLRHQVARELASPDRCTMTAAVLTACLVLAGLSLSVLYGPPRRPLETLSSFSLVALAATIPLFLAERRRVSALFWLNQGGVILTKSEDLAKLTSAEQWMVDPRLLAQPGSVEVLALSDSDKGELLAIAGALVSEVDTPDGVPIRHALAQQGRAPSRGAAFSVRGEVLMGTVHGSRWHLGTRSALEKTSGIKVPKAHETALTFLAEEGRRVLLLGSPDQGVVGAFGLGVEVSAELAETARSLHAELGSASDVSEHIREQLAAKAGIPLATKRPSKRTLVILHEDSSMPSTGACLRVAPLRIGLELREGAARLLEPAVDRFSETLSAARNSLRASTFGLGVLLGVPLAGLLLSLLGWLLPSLAAALVAGGLWFCLRENAPKTAQALETPLGEADDAPSEDVSLSGIEPTYGKSESGRDHS